MLYLSTIEVFEYILNLSIFHISKRWKIQKKMFHFREFRQKKILLKFLLKSLEIQSIIENSVTLEFMKIEKN